MKEARWWQKENDGKILCTLCPRFCKIDEGQSGFCFIRKVENGKLISTGYGHPTGFAIDPIEKKPMNHFLPGSKILSFGTAGCNLGCKFCQNWLMSKAKSSETKSISASPEDVINIAIEYKVPSIAYTYNEPTIFGEYVIDISKLGREAGIKSVMVTAGYITSEARKEVYQFIDAANVDLKSFSEIFYHKLTNSHLEPILDTFKWLKNETNIWFEITNLLIPDENDSNDEIKNMCEWILINLGDEIPIHFSAFHPDFKMTDKKSTPLKTLIKAKNIANEIGLKFIYIGNVLTKDEQSTFCPNCKKKLIGRDGFSVSINNLKNGCCKFCNYKINGIFVY